MEVLAALAPPLLVGGAFIYGVVKLVRSEAVARDNDKDEDVPVGGKSAD
ncbi:hypothetical protein [Rhizohabitans arisaemae]|nr:hypothetical protein [Rhizohabitans arisaemae]